VLKIFKKTFKGLEKTRKKVSNVFSKISKKTYLDDDDIELLEDCLLQADISYGIIQDVLDAVRNKDSSESTWRDRALRVLLSKIQINQNPNDINKVIILVGINGSGKTTSAAKLAKLYSSNNEKVCLVAGDTYRAAALEQIEIWSKRLDVRLVQNPGTTDSASIAFDGVESGIKRRERVIIDTAGRLHTSANLMNELKKIHRVVSKITDNITTLMVIDGNIGKNSLLQLEHFNKYLKINGIIITKLDGTAKGGIALTAISDYKVPVYFIGVGEGSDDLIPFAPEDYLNSILGTEDE
jgi:fused signal recognition particle receptor